MPWPRRWVASEAGVVLALTRMALRALPFALVRRGLAVYARLFSRRHADARDLELVRWAMAGIGRRTPRSSCLPEALTAWAMLRRRTLPATLHLGVRRPDRGRALDAHAWVESAGQVVVGDVESLAAYQTLVSGTMRLTDGVAALLRGEPVSWSRLATDPATFVEYCADGDLTGLVHQALSAGHHDWPPAVTHELAVAARAHLSAEMIRTRETTRVLDTLAACGVGALVFKGTALAHAVYPNPSLRPRNDTDLLIPGSDRRVVDVALHALGYSTTNLSGGDVLFRQYELQREDEFGIVHAFDVHWGLSTQALFADLFELDELHAQSVPIPPLGSSARGLGPADALLVACVHPAMHHRNEERLIWVYDTHLLAGRCSMADWARFADAATAKSVAAICLGALRRAATRLGTSVPGDVLRQLETAAARDEPTARYLENGRRWRDELTSSLAALGWRGRLRLLREVAFPAPGYMLSAYGMSGARFGAAFLPALYVHRGARGIWKVLTGRK